MRMFRVRSSRISASRDSRIHVTLSHLQHWNQPRATLYSSPYMNNYMSLPFIVTLHTTQYTLSPHPACRTTLKVDRYTRKQLTGSHTLWYAASPGEDN